MTARIIKYRLDPVKVQVIEVPEGAEPIEVHEQEGCACIWFMRPAGTRLLQAHAVTCRSSGEELSPRDGTYIGTAHIHEGRTVVHVFID